ncbi:hypothetical protein A3K73_00710 [Candidatus Pacearchaeota archaeon RBG_13_36_9]|nr:MAG: hypothetical protein A3K73_00710 [Candidatus Pacearchaeota archaeon RBG_13_36_9]
MAKKKVAKKYANKKEDSKIYAFLTAFLSIIGFIIAMILWKDDDLVMYYAKHSLIIFIGWVITAFLRGIPVLGNILMVLVLVVWIISWVFALTGEKKDMWVLTQLAEKINL